MEFKEVI